ncbi:MAG: hypothetical protein AUH11_03445 [Acidobacteria bacterium 13_2_20CM_57_17]|nr:MAG: hypothetical protein AUH11_03445 [Acidobacteria bacterium 13_2_20CM_57_17]OLB91845.1 MAG: hypothetical protein AUI02_09080 [Acidobacteria bacterium 13_2_20CM_2_57_12]OLE15871.1 MAG: hypothetical protein AUG83_05295 [Acidobacteria bacterium 13_1_20CM_4_57_11]
MSGRNLFRKIVRNFLCLTAALLTFTACAYTDYRLWPLDLDAPRYPALPTPKFQGDRLILPFAPGIASAEVATFHDQLEAFLHFEYLRGRDARDGGDTSRILLTAFDTAKGPIYKVFIVTDNDLLTAVPRLSQLEGRNLIKHYDLNSWTQKDFYYFQQQSHMFDVAYGVPTEQKLESLSSFRLLPALAQFLIFKSQTDNRVLARGDMAPSPLTREQATQLATDILDVAQFYSLPLDYFLGVGAMENDYMDVNGDLTHAVWKKRAQRDDIILRRGRKRVMVSNYAIGIWQITRETLRAAHQLYLKDKRDYSLLPARLRPSRSLDLNSVDDAVLTTYAGLLLRGLLDHFGGDVDKAIGAYNGGVKTPNPAYAAGVKTVAEYARRVLEHATAMDDPPTSAKSLAAAPPADPAQATTPAPANSQQKQPWRRDDD